MCYALRLHTPAAPPRVGLTQALGLHTKLMSQFKIDLTEDAQSNLEAQALLDVIDNNAAYHTAHNLRPPVGIYNVSTLRVLNKVVDLSEKLETYVNTSHENANREKSARALIDYIELSIYAAAEHVDDLEHISKYFYNSERERTSCIANKQFQKDLKQHKRFIAAVANYIKHSQHRIRLYQLDFIHAGRQGAFHGYIIESVSDGVVGPSPIFHTDQRNIFSVTTLAWEILTFVLKSSRSLATFLADKKRIEGPTKTNSKFLSEAIIAAARLPLYNLDEDHPFDTTPLKLQWDETSISKASSALYGSVFNGWDAIGPLSLGRSSVAFAGDGVTRTFKMLIKPTRVSLRHWQQA